MDRISLEGETKKDLLEIAKDLNVPGRSRLSKTELIDAILQAKEETAAAEGLESKAGSTAKEKSLRSKESESENTTFKAGKKIPYMQSEVEDSRYYTGMTHTTPHEMEYKLPEKYEEDRIVLMTVDPARLHAYWEISDETIEELHSDLGKQWEKPDFTLRVHNMSRNGSSDSYFDIPITGGADNWYINIPSPGNFYCTEIGVKTANEFMPIIRSNIAEAPRYSMSDVTEERWTPDWRALEAAMAARYGNEHGHDFTAEEIYALSGGFDIRSSSIDIRKALQEHFEKQLASGVVSSFGFMSSPGLFSPGISSWSIPNISSFSGGISSFSGGISSMGGSESMAARRAKGRKFWYMLDAELIVYGATEPDATVTLQGIPLRLRPDGTFTARFALPDGLQNIPVVFESADKVDKGTIEPKVSRNTEYRND